MSSPPRLTAEQRDALAVRDSSVALGAGAGCGKTTVLTERFVRALAGPDPVPLGRIVALTFTNKAARELRDRIRRECRRRVLDGDDPAYWRGVVRGLAAARIGTFHSFCGEVLRRHAIEAGIDPGFAVLDEPVAGALRDEALALALREALAHRDRDLIELAVDFGLVAVRVALGTLLTNRAGGDVEAWAGMEPGQLVGRWLDRFHGRVRPALLDRLRAACAPCLARIAATGCDHAKVRDRLANFAAAVARLDDAGAGDPVPAILAVGEAAKVQGLVAKVWPTVEFYEAIQTEFKEIREVARKVAAGLEWDEATSREAAAHGIRFARLAVRVRAAYQQLKLRRGGVDNDDLLLLARQLVADDASTVRATLGESADLILVDEFQDTDPIQGEILTRMTGADAAGGDSRLFLVGDFKQSIYRFRGADPELFREFRARVPAAGRRNLTENFRSVPGILRFVNALFGDTFTEEGSALRPGGGAEDDAGRPPAVLFSWGAPAAVAPGDKPGRPDVGARRVDEARRLARYVADRLARGWPIRDPGTHAIRPAHAGDVAILFRSLGDSATYEAALAAEGLDFHVVGGSGFFAQQEVLDLINVLSAVEDPSDAVSLAGTLRSPFFSISDDALFWVAVECPGAVHQGLEKLDVAILPAADRPRVERARRQLAAWRGAKDATPIAALVDRILDESGYEAALLGEFLGDRKRANARKLVRMARRLDDAGGFTLADFVERLRSDLRAATKETQAATTDDGGEIVRLMSIHQSKGLEFPIVVIPDLERKRPGELRRVAFDADLGPLVNPVADADDGADEADGGSGGSLGWLVYRHLEAEADDAESLRLLYVATTRARDFLILSAATDPGRPARSPALALLDRRFDRATGAALHPPDDGGPPPRAGIIPPEPEPGPAPTDRARGGVPKVPLLAIAEAIDAAQARPILGAPRRPPGRLPRWVRLDPAARLTTTEARLDRLCRAILLDPRALDPAATPEIAPRAARLQDPVAGPTLVAAAVDRVRGWLDRLPAGLRCDDSHCAGRWDWTIAWPPAGPTGVFEGWGDYRFHHADGSVDLVVVGAGPPSPAETLRATLTGRSRPGRVDRVVWTSWDPNAGPVVVDRFDDAATQLAIDLWADSARGG